MSYFVGFALLILLIEVFSGQAVLWKKYSVAFYDRAEEPGAFWLTVILQAMMSLGVGTMIYFAKK